MARSVCMEQHRVDAPDNRTMSLLNAVKGSRLRVRLQN